MQLLCCNAFECLIECLLIIISIYCSIYSIAKTSLSDIIREISTICDAIVYFGQHNLSQIKSKGVNRALSRKSLIMNREGHLLA